MPTPFAAHVQVRRALRALVPLVALLALLAVAAPAGAAKSCGRAVIDDWYDDGRIDGTYALHCYDDAIEILPRDVRVYSSAEEDVRSARQAAKRGEDAPPARTDPSPENTGGGGGSSGGTGSGTPGIGTVPTETTVPSEESGTGNEASAPLDTESASSVPIPLLILAGLALLLVAGGSAGYLVRRHQARRVTPPAI